MEINAKIVNLFNYKEKNMKLLDMLPSLLGYVETFKKFCISIDECTVEIERTEIEQNSKNF